MSRVLMLWVDPSPYLTVYVGYDAAAGVTPPQRLVSWGDGTPAQEASTTDEGWSLYHAYAAPGTYLITATEGGAPVEYATATVPGVGSVRIVPFSVPGPPSVAEVEAYLGDSTSWDTATIASAHAAEVDAQANVCRIPEGAYPAALAEALFRRVAHNLALRALPLGVQATVSDMAVATNRVAGLDAEVARLEGPYRKMVLG